MAVKNQLCPCGSKQDYRQCCQPIHQGKAAENAQQLMRARYSAYVFKLNNFLLQSWAQEYRPKQLEAQSIQWVRLKITEHKVLSENRQSVRFIATWKENGKAHKMAENSLFEKRSGRWLYLKALPEQGFDASKMI